MNEEELLRWRGFQAYYNYKTNQQLGIANACLLRTHKGKRYLVLARQLQRRGGYAMRCVLRVHRVRTQGGGMLKMLKRYPKELDFPTVVSFDA